MKVKLRWKIMAVPALITVCILAGSVVLFHLMGNVSARNKEVRVNMALQNFLANKVVDHVKWMSTLKDQVYMGVPFKMHLDPHECDLGKWYYSATPPKGEAAAIFAGIEEPHRLMHESAKEVVALYNKGDAKGAAVVMDSKSRVYQEAVKAKLDELAAALEKDSKKSVMMAEKSERSARYFIIAAVIVAFILSILAFVMSHKVVKPILKLTSAAGKIADGDFTHKVECYCNDELGVLAMKFNEMQVSLSDTIRKISEMAKEVADASTELSRTSESMARGATDQDSEAAQVATAMDEMSATVTEVARNSAQAADSAREAATTAKDGGGVVEKTVSSMEKIARTTEDTANIINTLGQSSDKIGEIVAVINDIADQTNLLALNAAIEAARAGEQGRGFAVVADEVRKLAERTTKATKEIASMIKTIQSDTSGAVTAMGEGGREVTEGVALAREAGAVLDNIIGKVATVTEMVQRIAAAAEEQSTASEEISGNVEAIAGVVKQNSLAARDSSASAQELAMLAQELQALVSKFEIGNESCGGRVDEGRPSFGGNVINGRELFGAKKAA